MEREVDMGLSDGGGFFLVLTVIALKVKPNYLKLFFQIPFMFINSLKWMNNDLTRYNGQTIHNFNFQNFQNFSLIKNTRKLLTIVSFQTTVSSETWLFEFISLFSKIRAKKL